MLRLITNEWLLIIPYYTHTLTNKSLANARSGVVVFTIIAFIIF